MHHSLSVQTQGNTPVRLDIELAMKLSVVMRIAVDDFFFLLSVSYHSKSKSHLLSYPHLCDNGNKTQRQPYGCDGTSIALPPNRTAAHTLMLIIQKHNRCSFYSLIPHTATAAAFTCALQPLH